MTRFDSNGRPVLSYPTQPFPFSGGRVLYPTLPGNAMSPPGMAAGQSAPGAPSGYGMEPAQFPLPQTPNTVQTPDTSYWQAQQSLLFSPYNIATFLPGFSAPAPAPVLAAVWSSPVFDLRPNLVASPQQATGQPLSRGSQAELVIRFYFTPGVSAVLNAYIAEAGNPFSPVQLDPIADIAAIPSLGSSKVGTSQGNTAQVVLRPPAGVRFWQVQLAVCNVDPAATGDTGTVYAAAY